MLLGRCLADVMLLRAGDSGIGEGVKGEGGVNDAGYSGEPGAIEGMGNAHISNGPRRRQRPSKKRPIFWPKPLGIVSGSTPFWVPPEAQRMYLGDRSAKAGTDIRECQAPTEPEPALSEPTNLILYGPPGTGKTFATADRGGAPVWQAGVRRTEVN